MTANAKSLTKPAIPPMRLTSVTAPVAEMRTFANAFECLGHDVDTLLSDVGLSRHDLNDPDRRVPCEVFGSLISRAQHKRFTPNLGLAIAPATPLGAYPLLDYLVLTCDTVGDGLAQVARYLRVTASPVSLDLDTDGDPVRVEIATMRRLRNTSALALGDEARRDITYLDDTRVTAASEAAGMT